MAAPEEARLTTHKQEISVTEQTPDKAQTITVNMTMTFILKEGDSFLSVMEKVNKTVTAAREIADVNAACVFGRQKFPL
jgi:hypothetical protein